MTVYKYRIDIRIRYSASIFSFTIPSENFYLPVKSLDQKTRPLLLLLGTTFGTTFASNLLAIGLDLNGMTVTQTQGDAFQIVIRFEVEYL